MSAKETKKLKSTQLAQTCSPDVFKESGKHKISKQTRFIGQDRAIDAIEFGLKMNSHGYNIYVAGLPGLGKGTIVSAYLNRVAEQCPNPDDWCYVYNFEQPDSPKAIKLASGKGVEFANDMDEFVQNVRSNIKKTFNSAEFKEQRGNLIEKMEKDRKKILEKINRKIEKHGLVLRITEQGILSLPAIDGEPIPLERLRELSPEQRNKMVETNKLAKPDLEQAYNELQKLERKSNVKMAKLLLSTAESILTPFVNELLKKYSATPDVVEYLNDVRDDIYENTGYLFPEANPRPQTDEGEAAEALEEEFRRYSVNVFIDNSHTKGAPVIRESNLSYYNLFGRVEHKAIMGALVTDFTMIKPGALHRANGGYLVIHANDLLRRSFVYDSLKRALRNKEIRIEDPRQTLDLTSTVQLRPQSIPLDTKIILVGSQATYYLIRYYDEEFRKLFKVKAEFDTEIKRTKSAISLYGHFIRYRCEKENLPKFTNAAKAAIVDYAALLAGNQDKLSTKFSEISDVIREAAADLSANSKNKKTGLVKPENVNRAIKNRHRRFNLFEDKLRESINDKTVLLSVKGKTVGQLNGLAVYDLDDIAFGKPSRITAAISLGRKGIVDIEREAKMSGNIHTKGVMILKNYLAENFAQDFPISISASLCFEQNYGGIDGDSASCAELYVLLSAISGLPLDQGIAVTGSVNQKGEVQPIGGVNHKIEGYFDACKNLGFTGKQGVMIPKTNVKNLMLPEDIRKEVAKGRFNIWAVESIAEGIEILTGMPAGNRLKGGKYPEKTVFGIVEKSLYERAMKLQDFGKDKSEKTKKKTSKKKK